ncbi:uncharacterized protein LOC114294094 isoform X2 [Camellia sinensis]|uniref:uncharacterized protein LOC114294094 isoform X2 n=1 Tax=Camellia sinensis TaxID=4442 RepID=UPI0010369595|nr:uncharacterized protein LOC114294094 isoform X2 [Camellia sinensis]
MESTLYAATRTTLFICRLHRPIHCQSVSLQLTRPFNGESQRSKALSSISHSPNSLPTLCSVRSRLHCAASPSSTAGGGGADGGALSPDAIIINVEGMMCGGCVASVKRILESQVRELLKETFHYRKSKGFLASATSPLMVCLIKLGFLFQRLVLASIGESLSDY